MNRSNMKGLFLTIATLSLGPAAFPVVAVAQSKVLVSSVDGESGPVLAKGHSGYDHQADKHESDKTRSFSTDIHSGVLTVDGMVGKAQMNYRIADQRYMYFTVPGVGTAIVSQTRFMNSLPQKGAFHGNVLTFQANGHTVELTSDNSLVGGKSAEAWVAIDPLYGAGITFPMMGFGDSLSRPYVWPGSKAEKMDNTAYVSAPPLPKVLLPKPEIASSYSVTVPASQTNR